jgi:hypothetical protein
VHPQTPFGKRHGRRAVRRLHVLAGLVALVAPLLAGAALGASAEATTAIDTDTASARPSTAAREPAQRYITALVNKKLVRKGRKVKISGRVDAPGVPACAAGVTLNVERSTHGAVYKVVGAVTTDAVTGAYAVKTVVKKKSRFRISAPATDACVAAQSPPRTVKIRPAN